VAPLHFDSPYAYGSHASVTFSWIDCCTPGSTIQSNNEASVVVVRNNDDPGKIYLREIEIYNAAGVNLALDGKCYTGWSPNKEPEIDSNCLNDGDTSGCNTETDSGEQGFDFCVLANPSEISRVKIYPTDDNLNKMSDIKLEVYAGVFGLEDVGDRKNAG